MAQLLNLQHRLVLAHQLALHLLEHLLVAGAALAHLFGVLLEDGADFVVDAVFQAHLFEQRGVDPLQRRGLVRGLDELAFDQLLGDLPSHVANVFFGEDHGARPTGIGGTKRISHGFRGNRNACREFGHDSAPWGGYSARLSLRNWLISTFPSGNTASIRKRPPMALTKSRSVL